MEGRQEEMEEETEDQKGEIEESEERKKSVID
jgi:hypothetical protein